MLKIAIWYIGTWVLTVLLKILFRFRHEGRENIPRNEGIILIGRHRSYWDIPMMIVAAGVRNQIVFIARDVLLKNPLFGPFVRHYAVTIDRDHFKREDFRKMLSVMEADQLVGIYPEGTTSETDKVRVGVVRFAERLNRDFIPFKIEADGPYPPKPPFGYPKVKATFGKRFGLDELSHALTGEESKGERYEVLAKALMERIDQVGRQSKVKIQGDAEQRMSYVKGRVDRG